MKQIPKSIFNIVFLLNAGFCHAQSEIGNFIAAGNVNANLLAKGYMSPMAKAYAANGSSGWFVPNNIKPGHVQFVLLAAGTFAPANDKYFNSNNIGLSNNVRLNMGQSPQTPTALGSHEKAGSAFTVYTTRPGTTDEVFLTPLNAPEGLGIPFVPLPLAQLSVGLTKSTTISARLLPTFRYQFRGTDYRTGYWGIGLQQRFDQWLAKNAPVQVTFLYEP